MTTVDHSHTPTPFMKRLSAADAEALAKLGTVRRFAVRQPLGYQGQVPECVFVLRSGCVKVCKTNPDGREVILAVRGPDDLVGELSAVDEQPRSASIVALLAAEAVVIPAEPFLAFLHRHPAAMLALVKALSERLRQSDAGSVQKVTLTTWSRVALCLVEVAERFGEPDGNTIELRLLTQEEIAGWTGSSLESVGRALQMMRQLGWIQTRPRRIRVLDLEALRRAGE